MYRFAESNRDCSSETRDVPADESVRAVAVRMLHTSGYLSLRGLQCDVRGGIVVLRGTVSSFYLKQMAQATILRLREISGVKNLIEVRDQSPQAEAGESQQDV